MDTAINAAMQRLINDHDYTESEAFLIATAVLEAASEHWREQGSGPFGIAVDTYTHEEDLYPGHVYPPKIPSSTTKHTDGRKGPLGGPLDWTRTDDEEYTEGAVKSYPVYTPGE